MPAKDIVDAFEKEYEMSFFSNRDRARDFTNGWHAAKIAEVQKPSHNSDYVKRSSSHLKGGLDANS